MFKTSALIALCHAALGLASESVENLYHVELHQSQFDQLEVLFPGEFDVWDENFVAQDQSSDPRMQVTIRSTPESMSKLTKLPQLFNQAPVNATLEDIDLQASVQSELMEMDSCRENTQGFLEQIGEMQLSENEFYKCFRPYTEIQEFLDVLVEHFQDNIMKFEISTTSQEQPIYAYRVSNGAPKDKILYIQGLLHAREWLALPSVIYTLTGLLDGITNSDSDVLELLEKVDFVIIPIVNVDGYEYSWVKDRFWRKNRRELSEGIWGVDLNRNYPPEDKFCSGKASDEPKSDIYCGEYPLSEPELLGIEDYLNGLEETIVGALDVHCYGPFVLRPYANTDETPQDKHLNDIGRDMMFAINSVKGGRFRSMPASKMYVAAGTFMDYFYEQYHGTPVFTLELRGPSFLVRPSMITTSGKEVFSGIQDFTQHCIDYDRTRSSN